MKNKKGFTLIELLAVIVILGVIMTIAIPNIVTTLDKNKKDTFIEDALRAITAAKYTMRANTEYEYPDSSSIVVLPFDKLENLDLEVSPYDTYYSYSKSFVAISSVKLRTGDDYERIYYVHLVSCPSEECLQDDDSLSQYRGINLTSEDNLSGGGRYDRVVKGLDLRTDYSSSNNDIVRVICEEQDRKSDKYNNTGCQTNSNVVVY